MNTANNIPEKHLHKTSRENYCQNCKDHLGSIEDNEIIQKPFYQKKFTTLQILF